MSKEIREASRHNRKVLFLCDLDSQVLGSLRFAHAFRDINWKPFFGIVKPDKLPTSVLGLVEGIFEITSYESFDNVPISDLERYSAVGVFATGSKIARVRENILALFSEANKQRPFLFCGFNGFVYEKFEEGLGWRLGYDAVCLNSPIDYEAATALTRGTNFESQAFPIIGMQTSQPSINRSPKRKIAIFADQVQVPTSYEEKLYLVNQLARLAHLNPEWEIKIKPRVPKNKRTFHKGGIHIEKVFSRIRNRPSNLVVCHMPLRESLENAQLLLTVSSTAIFEALAAGVTACAIMDFGIRNAYGTHLVFNSDIGIQLQNVHTLEELLKNRPNEQWLSRVGFKENNQINELSELISGWNPSIETDKAHPPNATGYYNRKIKLQSRIIETVQALDAEDFVMANTFSIDISSLDPEHPFARYALLASKYRIHSSQYPYVAILQMVFSKPYDIEAWKLLFHAHRISAVIHNTSE